MRAKYRNCLGVNRFDMPVLFVSFHRGEDVATVDFEIGDKFNLLNLRAFLNCHFKCVYMNVYVCAKCSMYLSFKWGLFTKVA